MPASVSRSLRDYGTKVNPKMLQAIRTRSEAALYQICSPSIGIAVKADLGTSASVVSVYEPYSSCASHNPTTKYNFAPPSMRAVR